MDLKIHVLFRYSKKTGKIDTAMTELGNALMQMWALQNTTPSKNTMIVERDTGKVVFLAEGTNYGFPRIKKSDKEDLGTVDEYGIPISAICEIKDERFDKDPEEKNRKKRTTRSR